ncbi:MAG: hypothetical protein COY40_00730 [Alphaproteobacteria bacterium CG_4_10_14_0_8_um_filter_53_9]|nr:MAG: hypothetical protein COY40_00730 [Alphaproteobacteria bacterium CG_4_10_14_0_8_um_filter_53_9]
MMMTLFLPDVPTLQDDNLSPPFDIWGYEMSGLPPEEEDEKTLDERLDDEIDIDPFKDVEDVKDVVPDVTGGLAGKSKMSQSVLYGGTLPLAGDCLAYAST